MQTLQDIVSKHGAAVERFRVTRDLDDNGALYVDLFDYYCNNGEMPYGVAKARDGDPLSWVINHALRDLRVA